MTNSSKTSSNTTTTTRTTEPGVFSEHKEIVRFSLDDMNTFREACLRDMGLWNGAIQSIISRFTDLEPDVILNAIFATGLAPRPSGSYLFAVLHRYSVCGLTTARAVAEDDARHDARYAY